MFFFNRGDSSWLRITVRLIVNTSRVYLFSRISERSTSIGKSSTARETLFIKETDCRCFPIYCFTILQNLCTKVCRYCICRYTFFVLFSLCLRNDFTDRCKGTPTKRPASKGPETKGPPSKGPSAKGPEYKRSGVLKVWLNLQ